MRNPSWSAGKFNSNAKSAGDGYFRLPVLFLIFVSGRRKTSMFSVHMPEQKINTTVEKVTSEIVTPKFEFLSVEGKYGYRPALFLLVSGSFN